MKAKLSASMEVPEAENSLLYLRENAGLGMTVIFPILSIFTVGCIFAIF